MNKIVILVLAFLIGLSEGFCPYGCGCDEENSIVTCIKAKLEVILLQNCFFQNFGGFFLQKPNEKFILIFLPEIFHTLSLSFQIIHSPFKDFLIICIL